MKEPWAERVCTAELIAGIYSLPVQALLLTEDVYGNPWWSLAGFGASVYVVADAIVRIRHEDKRGFCDNRGLTEIVLGSPVRMGKYFHRRYRCWRNIRDIDERAKKGEVYV